MAAAYLMLGKVHAAVRDGLVHEREALEHFIAFSADARTLVAAMHDTRIALVRKRLCAGCLMVGIEPLIARIRRRKIAKIKRGLQAFADPV